jgi:MFS family permease
MAITMLSFIALFTAVFIFMLGSGLLGTILSLRMSFEGFPEQIIGLILAGFYVGIVLGAFLCPSLVRRVGHIRSFAAFAATGSVSVLLHALWVSPLSWGLLRLINGLSMTGLYMVVESWLNECAAPETRGRVLAVYMALTFLGLGSSQFLIKVGDVRSQDLFLIVGMLFSLCLIPVVVTKSITPPPPKTAQLNIRKLLRQAPLGMFGCLTAGLINGSFYTLGPIFGLKMGTSISAVAWFMSITIISGLALQWPVGSLSDYCDRRAVLAVLSLLIALISLAIIGAGGRSLALLLALTAAYGGPGFTLYPVAVAHTQDHISAEEILPVSSALILFYGIGASFGPVLSSKLMAVCGPSGLYVFISVCGALFGATSYYFWKRKPVEVEKPVAFIPMPRTSPEASTLDPRTEPQSDPLDSD